VRDESGNVLAVLTAGLETTDRVLAERTVREQEERLRVAARAADVFGWEIDLRAQTFTGRSEGPLGFGAPVPMERLWAAVHPDDRSQVQSALARGIEQLGDFAVEHRVVPEGGGEEIWAYSAGRAVPGEDGTPDVVVGVSQDITARKRIEIATTLSEARFHAIAELVPDLLAEHDSDGRSSWHNRRWLEYTGQTDEQAIGDGWTGAIHPGDRDRVCRTFARAVEAERPFREECRIRRHDGTYHWFVVRVVPSRDESGKVSRWFGSASDVDEQRLALERERAAHSAAQAARAAADEARERAQKADRAKGQFLSNVSHELRTPLSAVVGYCDLLATRTAGSLSSAQLRYVSLISSAAWHLVGMIDQILAFARSESGRETVQLGETDVVELVRDAVEVLSGPAEERGLVLRNAPHSPILATTDSGKVRQIILNLVGNAVKFTERGTVEVEVGVCGDHIEVRVKDTGCGIPAERLEDIFEPFVQVDGSTTRTVGGTGLGLTIARRMARLLGGDLAVESTPGKGSTFTLRLPLHLEAAAA